MLLDEDPATLIHECTSNFHFASDRDSLFRISTSLQTLSQSRHLRLTSQTGALKKLTRRLNTLTQQHELERSSANSTQHAEEIVRLDGVKFKIAKEASDAEIEGERLDGECRRAESALAELERGGSLGGAEAGAEQDREVLKLKIYRSLGIEMELDAHGQYSKAVVRNKVKGTVDVVEADPQVSITTYADRFWDSM